MSRRTRLAIATVVALGTASPLVLFSAPGAPSPSWVQAAQPQIPATDAFAATTVATPSTTTAPPQTTIPPTTRPTPALTTAKTPRVTVAPPRTSTVTPTTARAATVNPVAATPSGPPRPCTTADISVVVTTDHPTYLPGDTATIAVAATNGSTDTCGLNDPPQTPPNGAYCQPQVSVYAPADPSQPGIFTSEAVLNPACSTASTHTLAPGQSWRISVSVTIPVSNSQWPPGSYRVDAYWVGPPVWKSGETAFTVMAPAAPAATTQTTGP